MNWELERWRRSKINLASELKLPGMCKLSGVKRKSPAQSRALTYFARRWRQIGQARAIERNKSEPETGNRVATHPRQVRWQREKGRGRGINARRVVQPKIKGAISAVTHPLFPVAVNLESPSQLSVSAQGKSPLYPIVTQGYHNLHNGAMVHSLGHPENYTDHLQEKQCTCRSHLV